MKDIHMTLEWLDEQIESELEHGNKAQAVRDYALLCIARNELAKRHGMHDHHDHHHGPLTMEQADAWVSRMENGDGTRGAYWTYDEIMSKAPAFNVLPKDVLEFWVVVNMLHSDYCEVAKRFGVDHAEFYAAMAKAWMHDKDAAENKTARYEQCVVKH